MKSLSLASGLLLAIALSAPIDARAQTLYGPGGLFIPGTIERLMTSMPCWPWTPSWRRGPQAYLSPARYTYIATYVGTGAGSNGDIYTISKTITTDDTTSQIQTQTRIDDFRAGLAAQFGLGPDSKTVTTTLTNSSSTNTKIGSTVQSQIHMFTGKAFPIYAIDVYYDKVFGTLAVKTAQ